MSGLEHAALFSAVIILLPLYFFIWWEHKDLQRKMTRLSLFGCIIGPVAAWWYLGDYLRSGFDMGVFGFFMDLLVAFLLIGVTSVTVNVLLHKRSKNTDHEGERSRYVLAFVLVFGTLLVLTELFEFSSLLSSALGLLVVALFIWNERRDLMPYSFVGGGALLVFGLIAYMGVKVFLPAFDNYESWDIVPVAPNVTLPLKEWFWLFSWGLVGSVLYEWRHGYHFVSRHGEASS